MSTLVPKGFRLAVAEAAFKKAGRNDLALALSDFPAASAGVFTTNLFKAAPVLVGRDLLNERRFARAVLINSGQANACTGPEGIARCRESLALAGSALDLEAADILPASTGVIGVQIDLGAFAGAVPKLAQNLGKAGIEDFASAIMTTDAFPKFCGESLDFSGKKVLLAGVAKGAGMICPNMATMLSAVFCDAEVRTEDWRAMFKRTVDRSFNRVTVDDDTSTNDTLYGLANGASGAKVEGKYLHKLEEALVRVLEDLAYKLVKDGEGATKVMHIKVLGAASRADAEAAARTVGRSQLVKTAMYGRDANWGRVICALGRSGADFKPEEVSFALCGVTLFKAGQPTDTNFDVLLKDALEKRDLALDISLGGGPGEYLLLASDLGHEYVSLNADYRS
ncbi:MAG: bifunctional glutamate N-acetyltransferase/amino-acid acetyltransferase ArgJ [Desulfovibrio sp.]|jgi:glutamate N-acetyltransferase/amino-acid N-acetyltransferase|nr:bifunctional glutamate N-acetyltransferase/amino-acid acetyltransferase ArgJ [Desulfovibrio sp.]